MATAPVFTANGTSGSYTVTASAGALTTNFSLTNNTPPVANNQSVTTNEDTAKNITLTGSDADGNSLTFTVTSSPAHGTLSGTAPNLTYTPETNYNGPDSFTFKVNDGRADSGNGTVSITVNAVNDAPSFTKGANQTVDEDAGAQTVPNWATNTSAGPSNESGQTVDFIVTNDNNALFLVQPAVAASGTLTYTPAANANGMATVTVKIHDDGGTANGGQNTSAAQTFTITLHSIADTPSVTNATTTINQQTTSGLVITRNGVDGLEVQFFKITNIQNGTLFRNDGSVITNGTFLTIAEGNAGLKFTPNAGLASPTTIFSFDVQAANNGAGDGISSAATATITVTCSAGSVVTNTNDSGAGSLRDALINACPSNNVTFNIPTTDPGYNAAADVYTITLTTAELVVDRDLSITGLGAKRLKVARSSAAGAPNFRIFQISGNTITVNISGLTVSNGNASGANVGGGININSNGTTTLTSVAITNNSAADGGGFQSLGGTVNIVNSLIAGNTARTTYGQAFYNQELRRVFVFMEYIGYLRRNPDTAGYVFWLGKLNFYNGDPFQAEMVRSFILSPEYRSRFGQP